MVVDIGKDCWNIILDYKHQMEDIELKVIKEELKKLDNEEQKIIDELKNYYQQRRRDNCYKWKSI